MAPPIQNARPLLRSPEDVFGRLIQDHLVGDLGPLAAVSPHFSRIVSTERDYILGRLREIPAVKLICDHSSEMQNPLLTPRQKLDIIQKKLQPGVRRFGRTDDLPQLCELAAKNGPILLVSAMRDDGLFTALVAKDGLDLIAKRIISEAAEDAVSLDNEGKLTTLLPKVQSADFPRLVKKALKLGKIGLAESLIKRRVFGLDSVLSFVRNPLHLARILQVAREYGRTYGRGYNPEALRGRPDHPNESVPSSGLQAIILKAIDNCYHPDFLNVILLHSAPGLEMLEHARDRARFDQLYLVPGRFEHHVFFDQQPVPPDPGNRRAVMIASLDRAIARFRQEEVAAAAIDAPPPPAVQLINDEDIAQEAIAADIVANRGVAPEAQVGPVEMLQIERGVAPINIVANRGVAPEAQVGPVEMLQIERGVAPIKMVILFLGATFIAWVANHYFDQMTQR